MVMDFPKLKLTSFGGPKIPTESGRKVKEHFTYFNSNTGNNKQVKC